MHRALKSSSFDLLTKSLNDVITKSNTITDSCLMNVDLSFEPKQCAKAAFADSLIFFHTFDQHIEWIGNAPSREKQKSNQKNDYNQKTVAKTKIDYCILVKFLSQNLRRRKNKTQTHFMLFCTYKHDVSSRFLYTALSFYRN